MKILLDELSLVTIWGPCDIAEGILAVKIDDLLSVGFKITATGELQEMDRNNPIHANVPTFTVCWLPHATAAKFTDPAKTLSIPVYEDAQLQNLVVHLTVPCRSVDQAKWILNGGYFTLSSE